MVLKEKLNLKKNIVMWLQKYSYSFWWCGVDLFFFLLLREV